MVSRRRFLQVGAAAAAVPLVASPSLSSADTATMPPSLAALKSRRDEAKPITREERTDRQEKARHLMAENKLDAILLMEGTSLNYFTGIRWWGGERTFACVIPAKGEAFHVCPAFEEGRAREQIRNGPSQETADVRTWQEDESPYQLIAQGLKDRGISTGTLDSVSFTPAPESAVLRVNARRALQSAFHHACAGEAAASINSRDNRNRVMAGKLRYQQSY